MADSSLEQNAAELHRSLSSYELGDGVKDYEYEDLGVPQPSDPDYRDKKRFRLLNLMSGFLDSPTVYCEIFEVEVNIAKDEVYIVHDSPSDRETCEAPANNIEYEALSWRWGNESDDDHAIIIKTKHGERKKRVSNTLGLALKYLRYQTEPRNIWIDALCINQSNFDERSSQVAMMDRLYTGASKICVWLGQDDQDSRKAIKFIKEEINELRDFDKLCKNSQHAEKWRALLGLMQRDWFSRRWVVQELALARKARVYCGPDQIKWRELAIAIELFVEVESATHRLSELMKKDDRFNVIPNWFEHISELGASLLVTETSKIFRDYKRESNKRPLGLGHLAERGPGRRSLLSLEYLVTSLSIFDCGRPHDFVYALVAISRDAFPSPPTLITQRSKEALVTEVMKGFVERKPFPLDYDIPYPDVARDFVEFTIQRHVDTGKDEEKALDILCRPWSKDWRPEDEQTHGQKPEAQKKRLFEEKASGLVWKILGQERRDEYKFKHAPMCDRREDDPRSMKKWRQDAIERGNTIISEDNYKKKWDPWFRRIKIKPEGEGKRSEEPGVTRTIDTGVDTKPISREIHLPSWVANVTKAPFDIFPHPGVEMTKMGRKNADPLVGSLDNRAGTYSAAQSKKQDSKDIKFKKRARLSHYSLYVKGFRFDKVDDVEQVSQQGAIPASWLRLGGWENAIRPKSPGADPGIPPDALWRTLVADRGMHNQNPPYYYSRACRETIMKGALRSNAVDTMALIYNERNSIIAEFCRRTQCVIWNRAMIKTQNGHLGLVSPDVRRGDLVCIIYGCTVPVILRRAEKLKTGGTRRNEMKDDCLETFKRCFRKCLQRRARKFEYEKQSDAHKEEVKRDLSLWQAKYLAQTMIDELKTRHELSVVDGTDKPAGQEQETTPSTNQEDVSSYEEELTRLKTWLDGHPWQPEDHRDELLKETETLKEEIRVVLNAWRQSTEDDDALREWTTSQPSKWTASTINSWSDKLKKLGKPTPTWLEMLQWWHRQPRFLCLDKLNCEAAEEWLKWRESKPQGFGNEAPDGHQEPARITEHLTARINEWKLVKDGLVKTARSREENLARQRSEQMEEQLEKWQDSQKGRKIKRWNQMPSKETMKLKSNDKGSSSAENSPASSDEESDDNSEDESGYWNFKEETSNDLAGSDSDDEGSQPAGDNEKQMGKPSKGLGKKERQNLANERDPFRHYKFLGEAYIHGMMEGEAVSQSFYKKKPDHLFEIR